MNKKQFIQNLNSFLSYCVQHNILTDEEAQDGFDKIYTKYCSGYTGYNLEQKFSYERLPTQLDKMSIALVTAHRLKRSYEKKLYHFDCTFDLYIDKLLERLAKSTHTFCDFAKNER